MLIWLRDRLLRRILGGDLWFWMLVTMGVRKVEEVEGQSLKATQLTWSAPGQTLRKLYDRIPIWVLAILFVLSTLLILVLTGVELPEVV